MVYSWKNIVSCLSSVALFASCLAFAVVFSCLVKSVFFSLSFEIFPLLSFRFLSFVVMLFSKCHVLFSLALSWDPQRKDKFGKKEDDLDAAEN